MTKHGTLVASLAFGLSCGFLAVATEPPAKPSKELALDLGKDVTLKLVKVPAGKFVMGVPKDAPNRDKQDLDEREVTFGNDFWMGVTEVTQAQYEALMGRTPASPAKRPFTRSIASASIRR